METWILVLLLASSKTLDAGVSSVQVGVFASAAQCKSAAAVLRTSAEQVANGYANTVCVQTTHRSYER
jgi:hypothetical protein